MKSKFGPYVVLAAIAVQLTLGVAYIWSVFQNGVAYSIFRGDNASAALTFSLLLMAFTLGSVIGGKLSARYSIRRIVFIGGIIVSIGFFLASFVTDGYGWLLWLTYGIVGGAGMGFTYSTTIACAQKWYPHKRGLVSGIIVSALGFGGVLFTPLVEVLIARLGRADAKGEVIIGSGELNSFMVLSGIFLIVCTVASLIMRDPPEGHMDEKTASVTVAAKAGKDFTSLEMIKTPRFYLITATLLLACMGGLMMIGFAKPIAEAKGLVETAVIGVLAISVTNSMGRLVWGAVSDKLGRANTLIILFAGAAVLSLLVGSVDSNMLYVLIALIGFFYGGILGSYPSLTSDLFGAKNVAANYGFVLLGFGAGAIISSQIAGHFKNVAAVSNDISHMYPAFVIASCCSTAGVIMMLVLKASAKKRTA